MTESERRVYAFLAQNGIAYRFARHKRVSAIRDCRLAEQILGGVMPKNLLLTPRNESCYFLLIMHPDSAFITGSVSRQAGASRLSFASEQALNALFHTHPGAVSPFGFLFDKEKRVGLLIDKRLQNEKRLIFHPLENTASVSLTNADFFAKVLPLIGRQPTWVELTETRKEFP